MYVREKLVELIRCANYHPCRGAVKTIGSMFTTEFIEDIVSQLIANGVTVQECGNWMYYHKQNKAVCASCGFERDLDANFGKAIACPNCGAYMPQQQKGE